MSNEPIKALLIEDNTMGFSIILNMLDKSEITEFDVITTPTFNNGLKILETNKFDIILLDLDVSHNEGLESFKEILKRYISIPIIIVASLADEEIGIESIKYGVQDYLVKGEFNGKLLVRSLQYAIERKKLEGLFVY
jgi:response regulator of citrate/malate metabolism